MTFGRNDAHQEFAVPPRSGSLRHYLLERVNAWKIVGKSGKSAKHDQFGHAIRMRGGKHRAHGTAVREAQKNCPSGSYCVHHRADIVNALLQARYAGHAVREPLSPLVECHDATKRGKTPEE